MPIKNGRPNQRASQGKRDQPKEGQGKEGQGKERLVQQGRGGVKPQKARPTQKGKKARDIWRGGPTIQKVPFYKEKSFIIFVGLILVIVGYAMFKFYSQKPASNLREEATTPQKTMDTTTGQKGVNTPPEIIKARFQLDSIDNTDRLKVIVEGRDKDNDEITYNYEWFKNDEQVKGITGDTFQGFKKGDRIMVRVTPYDGKLYGPPRTIKMEILRSTPKVIEHKDIRFDGKELLYQVKAISPDGATLSYSLIDPPEAMTIDTKTGLLRWGLKDEFVGQVEVRVRITDNQGVETIYPLRLNIERPTERPEK